MAKKINNTGRNGNGEGNGNVNDPGHQDEENVYQKKNEEERKKIPVEYLGYVQRRRSMQVIKTLIALILAFAMLAFGPGMKGLEICPQCGRTRSYATLAYGRWEFRGLIPVDTEWTAWYEEQKPFIHDHHWVQFGKLHPSLFIYLAFPFPTGEAWEMPENLVDRMKELTPMFRPGKILEIPKTLHAVNNASEWRAIVVPLSLGTPQEAFQWWQSNQNELERWASKPDGTPLSADFIYRSEPYIKDKTPKDSSGLPLL